MKRRLAAVVASICLIAVVHAEVYRWIDGNGKVHYSDSPPKEQKTSKKIDIKINSISGPAVVSRVAASPSVHKRVRIFTATWCRYCKLAKSHFAKRGVSYEEIDVEATDAGRNQYQSLGGGGVPIILVGTQRMDGFDADGIDRMLSEIGK